MNYFIRSVPWPRQTRLLHQGKWMRHILKFFFNCLRFQMKTVKRDKESLQRAQQQDQPDSISEVTLEIRDLVSEPGQVSVAELYQRLFDKVNLLRRVIWPERCSFRTMMASSTNTRLVVKLFQSCSDKSSSLSRCRIRLVYAPSVNKAKGYLYKMANFHLWWPH